MGKELDRKDSDIEFADYSPSCMWGFLQILDYHQWNYIRKAHIKRKSGRGKHGICFRNPKTVSFEHFTDELQDYLEAESVPLMVEQKAKPSPVDTVSGKAKIKALIAREMSARSQLRRTNSTENLEPSVQCINGTNPHRPTPIVILHKGADSSPNTTNTTTNQTDTKQQGRESSGQQFKENVDVLEIFKVNKDLFLEILQEPGKNVRVQQINNAKVGLKKSVSFPAADSSSTRAKPSTLKHKQKEIWSFPKDDKLSTRAEVPEHVAYMASCENSTGLNADGSTGDGATITQETKFSSLVSRQGFNKPGWFMRHLKGIKKKIKHALKDRNQPSVTALFHRVPSIKLPIDDKEQRNYGDGVENPESYNETTCSGELPQLRRASSSSNASLDRYARLFEHRFSGEAKWHKCHSRSLRLTNEDKFSSTGNSLKSFRRRLSLPDLDSLYPLPIEESSDAPEPALPRPVMNCDTNAENDSHNDLKQESIDVTEVTEIEECTAEEIGDGIAKTVEDIENPEKDSHSCYQDPEIDSTVDSCKEFIKQIPISNLETPFVDEATTTTDSLVSGGTESGSSNIGIHESGLCRTANQESVESTNTMIDSHFLDFELNAVDKADFNYMRDVLEVSCFLEKDYCVTWHSLDQPLSPTLFKELEAYLHDCSTEDVTTCNHRIIFDFINEALLEIFETTLAYFPKSFYFVQNIRPLPKRERILEEVWKKFSWYQRLNLNTGQSLEDIVARDLAKDDGWMNINMDAEDVALDLEDLIFDELLDEAIYSM